MKAFVLVSVYTILWHAMSGAPFAGSDGEWGEAVTEGAGTEAGDGPIWEVETWPRGTGTTTHTDHWGESGAGRAAQSWGWNVRWSRGGWIANFLTSHHSPNCDN